MRVILLCAVLAIVLFGVANASIICETRGTTGSQNTLVATVVVNFGAAVSSSYQGNELARAFDVVFPISNRPIFVLSTSVSETNVTLTLRQDSLNREHQTGAMFRVNYTDLGFATRFLTVNGIKQSTSFLCTTVDRIAPRYRSAAVSSLSSGIQPIQLVFTEPVQTCSGGSFFVSNFTVLDYATTNVTLTPVFPPPTPHWWFMGDVTSPEYDVALPSNVVCDTSGNGNDAIVSSDIRTSLDGPFWSTGTTVHRLYDIDEDGSPDLAAVLSLMQFNSSELHPDQARILVDGVNVTDKTVFDDGYVVDETILVRFTSPPIVSTATLMIGNQIPAYSGLGFPVISSSLSRNFAILMPLFMTSVTGNMGSNQVTVTVWQAKSPNPPVSAFGVQSTYPFNISGFTGTPTLTSITLTLNASIRSVAEALATKIYMVPEVYNAASQGYPLWRPKLVNFTGISRSVVSRVGTGAWDTLTLTLVESVSADDVSTSNLRIPAGSGVTYTITAASHLSSTQVRYSVSQTCANEPSPCVDTSPDITYNLTIGSLSLTQLTTEYETVAPVFVGAAAVIGSNKIRVVTSESVVGFSPSTAFTGVTVIAQSGSGSEYTLTLSRRIKESDLSYTWLESDLVDVLGNEATEAALVFSMKATFHDDEGDGTITRLRLTTNMPHFEFSSSNAFSTIPVMTLGAVTRVSSTVSDIAITNGVSFGSSVTVEYISHTSLSARILLSNDGRGGLEIPISYFLVESSTETIGSSTVSFSDLSIGVQAGIISAIVGALLMGILATSYFKTNRVKTSKRHRHELLREVELDE